jgi:isopenicillin N synthase-like dioxygenase
MHLFQQHAVKDSALASAKIPMIDFGPYLADEPGALGAVPVQIRQACETVGFFYALNHGVPQTLSDRGFAASPRFHGLPIETRLALR